ncbi:MAG: hypothetical protein AAFP09_16405, partial [Cyanobacteria bacterium J06607_10]
FDKHTCFPLPLNTVNLSEFQEARESVMVPNLDWHMPRALSWLDIEFGSAVNQQPPNVHIR